jgi:flavin reductase (DIM6/NTAB) family NADH-FMN oxidoreductase RutF
MEKINIGTNTFVYPNPVTLLGANVEGRANFMSLGLENKTFSINFPDADMVEATDYCGLVSGKTTDKSSLQDLLWGA